jgi:hypothetical protein
VFSGQSISVKAAAASSSLSTKTNLTNTTTESGQRKRVALFSNIYVVWTDNTPGNYEILFRKSTDDGNTFSSTINLSNNPGTSLLSASTPQIAVAGWIPPVYVVWQDSIFSASGNDDILFGKSNASTLNLSNNAG